MVAPVEGSLFGVWTCSDGAALTHAVKAWTQHPHCSSASRYTARVELSSKVVDCEDRLQRTLAHELCHVAAWLLDHVSKPPHGQVTPDPVVLFLRTAICSLQTKF